MKKIVSLILICVMSIFTLSACDDRPKLKIFNWGEYIDESVLEEFSEKFGVKIVYDTFATNEEMYAKIKADPASYDIIFPSEYMAKRMIDEGLISKIDMSKIPNFEKIDSMFKGLYYDPNNEYTVPYLWGTLGILYNTNNVKEPPTSWDVLFNGQYNKRLLMIDSHRDTIAAALKYLGYSLNTTDPKELDEAMQLLIKQKPDVLAYVVDEVNDKMLGEEADIAITWSGNAIETMMSSDGNFNYIIPSEGSNWFVDVMCITEQSKVKDIATEFINFMCEKDIATRNCLEVTYSTPQSEVYEEVKKANPEFAANKAAFPSAEELKYMEMFITSDDINRMYDEIWQKIKAE
ncbi:MAG: ABC transporter substrate-binding protein [Monoglobales bacterium]